MKPEDYISELIAVASNPSRIKNGGDRKVISLVQYSEPMCFMLHKGTVALYRNEDHLMITHVHAPYILGLNFLNPLNNNIYLRARGEDIVYEIIPRSAFAEILDNGDYWKNVAYLFMYSTMSFVEYNKSITGVSTYELVCNNLLALMKESEVIRMNTNACDFILDKTLLSRSGIMKILSDLKKGDHIVMKRGVLLGINKLPAKY